MNKEHLKNFFYDFWQKAENDPVKMNIPVLVEMGEARVAQQLVCDLYPLHKALGLNADKVWHYVELSFKPRLSLLEPTFT